MAVLIVMLATLASSLAHEVVYVPVCGPDCCKSHIGNLPLGDHGQTYHPHLDVGSAHLYSAKYSQGQHLSETAHLKYSQGHQQDSAQVYQHNNQHLTEHKQTVHHHGSGVSQLAFEQEHHHGGDDLGEHHHGVGDDLGEHHHDDHHHKKNVHYKFEYSVEDHKTGDVKRHKEERKGDEVNGEYSLLEEDGNVRTVKYFADWKTGFHAQVHNSKLG